MRVNFNSVMTLSVLTLTPKQDFLLFMYSTSLFSVIFPITETFHLNFYSVFKDIRNFIVIAVEIISGFLKGSSMLHGLKTKQ